MLEYRFCESRNILSLLTVCIFNRGDNIPRGQKVVLEGAKNSLFLYRFIYDTPTDIQCIHGIKIWEAELGPKMSKKSP